MTEQEALSKMVAPGQHRPGKFRGGVIQIHLTRACDKACFGCTQGSNLGGKTGFMTVEQFEKAVISLKGYDGVVGVFGGNPALHPEFYDICQIMKKHVPYEQRGLWCNHPKGKAQWMRGTFNPAVSNLNVHLDRQAYDEFKKFWPESRPFGLEQDSRHSPPYVAMKDLVEDEGKRWELISNCDINQHWSAMIGVFRGELRAWFCELAGAQAMLHQYDPDYPDTGLPLWYLADFKMEGKAGEKQSATMKQWWTLPMDAFRDQVRKHCHECGVPLRGRGELACSTTGKEQVSLVHLDVYKPKKVGRPVETVTSLDELGHVNLVTDYLGNAKR